MGGCPPGEARITKGYNLPASFVIHTVGPIWNGGAHGEPETLRSCYRNSLVVAVQNGIQTIAFPAISCGAYGYPVPDATKIAMTTVREFLSNEDRISKVIFAVFGDEVFSAYRRLQNL